MRVGPGISLHDHRDWGCGQAFNTLKQMLIGAPVFGYAYLSKPFVLEIDPSGLGLRAVLKWAVTDPVPNGFKNQGHVLRTSFES